MTNGFLCVRIIKRQSEKEYLAELCSGSTADSDSVCLGSNPSSAAKENRPSSDGLFSFFWLQNVGFVPGICDEESAFANGEVSRLCIPPSAVSCHARRCHSPFVRAERLSQSLPRAAILYALFIQCFALMIYTAVP